MLGWSCFAFLLSLVIGSVLLDTRLGPQSFRVQRPCSLFVGRAWSWEPTASTMRGSKPEPFVHPPPNPSALTPSPQPVGRDQGRLDLEPRSSNLHPLKPKAEKSAPGSTLRRTALPGTARPKRRPTSACHPRGVLARSCGIFWRGHGSE